MSMFHILFEEGETINTIADDIMKGFPNIDCQITELLEFFRSDFLVLPNVRLCGCLSMRGLKAIAKCRFWFTTLEDIKGLLNTFLWTLGKVAMIWSPLLMRTEASPFPFLSHYCCLLVFLIVYVFFLTCPCRTTVLPFFPIRKRSGVKKAGAQQIDRIWFHVKRAVPRSLKNRGPVGCWTKTASWIIYMPGYSAEDVRKTSSKTWEDYVQKYEKRTFRCSAVLRK